VEVLGVGNVTQVAAGHDYTCALLVSGRTAHCWGDNEEGQLGSGGPWSVVPTGVL
jgi:alpha-tubulin suppressor-like RCC1 family protein